MDIITNLKKLGKIYSKIDINHKILRAFPKKLWKSKVTSIKEANNLSTLAHGELIGKLLTYEMENDENEKEDKKKSITFNAQHEDKSSYQKERSYHHRLKEETSESESQLDDSEVEQLSREYTLLMKKD